MPIPVAVYIALIILWSLICSTKSLNKFASPLIFIILITAVGSISTVVSGLILGYINLKLCACMQLPLLLIWLCRIEYENSELVISKTRSILLNSIWVAVLIAFTILYAFLLWVYIVLLVY